jgi:rare lipoprotein A (peptidoglycan hydrolase)
MRDKQIIGLSFIALIVLTFGLFIGERIGEDVAAARLEPTIKANAGRIAELECSVAVLTDRLERAYEAMQFVGTASFYGDKFHGRKMANGKPFDKNKLTAAHRTLPLGMLIRVTNLKTGEFIICPITDRGPYIDGRILDLSEAAFDTIADISDGLIRVQITPLDVTIPRVSGGD